MHITSSMMRTYRTCRKAYWFKYIERLEPVRKSDALKDGSSYHEKLEQIYSKGFFTPTGDKTDAMAFVYEKYVYPQFKMVDAEIEFEYKLNDKHILVGRIDGKAEDGLLVEHKTTGIAVDDKYIYALQFDNQILDYMVGNGINQMYYTVIRKPTIRQKQNETMEEYIDRCIQWYEEDTDNKIKVILVERSKNEIEAHKQLIIDMCEEIEHQTLWFCSCNPLAGRPCEYASLLLHYDPKLEYVDFVKRPKYSKNKEEEKKEEEDELF